MSLVYERQEICELWLLAMHVSDFADTCSRQLYCPRQKLCPMWWQWDDDTFGRRSQSLFPICYAHADRHTVSWLICAFVLFLCCNNLWERWSACVWRTVFVWKKITQLLPMLLCKKGDYSPDAVTKIERNSQCKVGCIWMWIKFTLTNWPYKLNHLHTAVCKCCVISFVKRRPPPKKKLTVYKWTLGSPRASLEV